MTDLDDVEYLRQMAVQLEAAAGLSPPMRQHQARIESIADAIEQLRAKEKALHRALEHERDRGARCSAIKHGRFHVDV